MDYNWWLKRLNTQLNNQPIKIYKKSTKLLSQPIRNHYYQTQPNVPSPFFHDAMWTSFFIKGGMELLFHENWELIGIAVYEILGDTQTNTSNQLYYRQLSADSKIKNYKIHWPEPVLILRILIGFKAVLEKSLHDLKMFIIALKIILHNVLNFKIVWNLSNWIKFTQLKMISIL